MAQSFIRRDRPTIVAVDVGDASQNVVLVDIAARARVLGGGARRSIPTTAACSASRQTASARSPRASSSAASARSIIEISAQMSSCASSRSPDSHRRRRRRHPTHSTVWLAARTLATRERRRRKTWSPGGDHLSGFGLPYGMPWYVPGWLAHAVVCERQKDNKIHIARCSRTRKRASEASRNFWLACAASRSRSTTGRCS